MKEEITTPKAKVIKINKFRIRMDLISSVVDLGHELRVFLIGDNELYILRDADYTAFLKWYDENHFIIDLTTSQEA